MKKYLKGAVLKMPLSVAGAAVLAVAVMFFACIYNDDGSGVPVTSTQNQPASPRSYIVSTVAGGGSQFPESADGPGATAGFHDLGGIALGPDGGLYVADTLDHKIRKVAADGTASTIAGKGFHGSGYDDGDCASATFDWPVGIVMDKAGNVYVADRMNNVIRKISMSATGCQVSTLAGSGTSGHADGTGKAASFDGPQGLAVDAAGNLYVTDGRTIRKVTPDGVVTTIAGNGGFGDTDGATSISALFRRPARLPAALCNRLFGDAISLTATFGLNLDGIAVDVAGNVYVSGTYIRKITPDGWVSKLAGSSKYGNADGVASKAAFTSPHGMAVDAGGNLYVADSGNHAVRKVSPAGEVATIAGAGNYDEMLAASQAAGKPAFYRDGPADRAMFYDPVGVVVDGNGVIYVADGEKIRKITTEP